MLIETGKANGTNSKDNGRSQLASDGKLPRHKVGAPRPSLIPPLLKTGMPAGLQNLVERKESRLPQFANVGSSPMPAETAPGNLAISMKRTARREREGPRLTNRELDVLGQVARGLSNKQIAGRLSLSEKTVRNHLSHIFEKLGACNRTEAVMTAMRSGLHMWP
jgi:DNA-binding CsgD family transcriptional regulator